MKVVTRIDDQDSYKYEIAAAITLEHNVKLYVEKNACGFAHFFGVVDTYGNAKVFPLLLYKV